MPDSAHTAPLDRHLLVGRHIWVGTTALAVLVAAYVYAPFVHDGPVLCPSHGVLGIPCPSCGLTRAFCSLSQFDIGSAVKHHALSPLLFAATLAMPFVCLYELVRGRLSWVHSMLRSRRVAWGFAALLCVYHVARVALWWSDGTLMSGYVETSWTYALLQNLGLADA